jgi:hypothetical protein
VPSAASAVTSASECARRRCSSVPAAVFERGADGLPEIARQTDCQTCFMCEAWCPTDALFVAPQLDPVAADSALRDERELARAGLLGSYRQVLGWGPGQSPGAARDRSFHVLAALHGPVPPRVPELVAESGPPPARSRSAAGGRPGLASPDRPARPGSASE